MTQYASKKSVTLVEWQEAVEDCWRQILVDHRHLDSALSSSPPALKSHLAAFLPVVLRRPHALYRTMGLDLKKYINPWTLSLGEERAQWKSLRVLAHHYWKICSLDGEFGSQPSASLSRQLAQSAKSVSVDDYPQWLFDEFQKDWGPKLGTRIAEILASDPPLSLRSAQKMGSERLLKALADQVDLPEGATVSSRIESGVLLPRYTSILNTSLYRDGLFEIQDEGSQVISMFTLWPELVKEAVAPHPGAATDFVRVSVPAAKLPTQTVVDACAGAGGKTLAIADYLRGSGRIFGYDVSPKKVQALRLRARRAGIRSAKAIALQEGDELQTLMPFLGTADRVLVDAPCSGIGILKRSPDIKWNQTAEGFLGLTEVQLRLLQLYSALVKPGGSLIYSTCTFRRSESVELVGRFQQCQPIFRKGAGGFFGPFLGGADGFFMQQFIREP